MCINGKKKNNFVFAWQAKLKGTLPIFLACCEQEKQKISATKIRAGEIGQDGKPLGKRPE